MHGMHDLKVDHYKFYWKVNSSVAQVRFFVFFASGLFRALVCFAALLVQYFLTQQLTHD